MADGVEFDFSDVLKLEAVIHDAAGNVGKFARQAVVVSSRHVRDDWREPLKASASIPAGAYTVSYDVTGGEAVRGTEIVGEIGPTVGDGRVGGLVGALEYGIPGKAGPTGYGAAALEKNQDDFVKGLEIAVSDSQKAAGL